MTGHLIDGTVVVEEEQGTFTVGLQKYLLCIEEAALQMCSYHCEAEVICPRSHLEDLDPKVLAKIPDNEPLILSLRVKNSHEPSPLEESILKYDSKGRVDTSKEILFQGDGKEIMPRDTVLIYMHG